MDAKQLLVAKEWEKKKAIGWSAKRELAKINYRIHTDAISSNLIPPTLTPQQITYVYANEADVLNVALFGMTVFWKLRQRVVGRLSYFMYIC